MLKTVNEVDEGSTMGNVARDFQRKKVYTAQRSIWDYQMPPVGNGDLDDVRDYVIEIMASSCWDRLCRKYGRRPSRPFAIVETGRKSAMCSTAILTFPSYEKTMVHGFNMRQPWVICHEMAHMATFHLVYTNIGKVAPHGPEFADAYVHLVTEMLGNTEGMRLYEAFERHGVKHQVNSFKVPTDAQIEAFYGEYGETWEINRYKNSGKAVIVGDAYLQS